MPRQRDRTPMLPPWAGIFDLELGPGGGLTVGQLKLLWDREGEELMRDRVYDGRRPWAYWRFELGEERPDRDQEPIRLAELGLLRDEEIAAITEKVNEARVRIGTPAEHISGGGSTCSYPDRETVELGEALSAALRRAARPKAGGAMRLRQRETTEPPVFLTRASEETAE